MFPTSLGFDRENYGIESFNICVCLYAHVCMYVYLGTHIHTHSIWAMVYDKKPTENHMCTQF